MSYSPKDPTQVTTFEELRDYVQEELGFVSQEFAKTNLLWLNPVARAPDKPREGMTIYADGTNFNPGAGKGVYEYDGANWVRYGAYPGASFSAYKNVAAQTLPSGGYTKVTFETEHYDLGGYYDAANSRFTPPVGIYRVNSQIRMFNTTGLGIIIFKNGAYLSGFWTPTLGAATTYAAVDITVQLNGTDYLEIFTWNYGAGGQTINADGDSWFEAQKVA